MAFPQHNSLKKEKKVERAGSNALVQNCPLHQSTNEKSLIYMSFHQTRMNDEKATEKNQKDDWEWKCLLWKWNVSAISDKKRSNILKKMP